MQVDQGPFSISFAQNFPGTLLAPRNVSRMPITQRLQAPLDPQVPTMHLQVPNLAANDSGDGTRGNTRKHTHGTSADTGKLPQYRAPPSTSWTLNPGGNM